MVKLDGSFLLNVDDDARAADFVAAVIALAHAARMAVVAMEVVESLRPRLNLVRATLVVLLPEQLRDTWNGLESLITRCGRQRNVAAHSLWRLSDITPDSLIRSVRGEIDERWDERDFSDILDRIADLRQHLLAFTLAVHEWQRTEAGKLALANA